MKTNQLELIEKQEKLYREFIESAQTKMNDLNQCINEWYGEIAELRVLKSRLKETENNGK